MSTIKSLATVFYVRFVRGIDSENPAWLNGVFTAAESLRLDGLLYKHESDLLSATFDWFNDHLPCPPFRSKLRSGEWSRNAVCWFQPRASEPIGRLWDIVALLREHDTPVRMIQSRKPGRIVYEDRFQVVAETPVWA